MIREEDVEDGVEEVKNTLNDIELTYLEIEEILWRTYITALLQWFDFDTAMVADRIEAVSCGAVVRLRTGGISAMGRTLH